MESASTSSQSPQGSSDYEVFISFRGTDTRNGFADYLYHDLIDAGIRAFRDNEELRVGEKIGPDLLKGIQSSKISVPVFSKNYASSKWCLLELLEMLECKKHRAQMIIPIFYDVEPSDVRNQRGSYEKAFEEHSKCFGEEIVTQWRVALKEVGALKGWELKNETDGQEGKLVKMIVTKLWTELKKSYPMISSDSLVGIDYHVKEMATLLDVNSDDVRVVGIHGMGGIGKTTIAKVMYDNLSKRFNNCCFLPDVRESSKTKGLVELQNYLICNLLKRRSFSVVSVQQGSNVIRDIFGNKKVLLVLDDVDKIEQFDALAQDHAWFGRGSRIIVTTRNKDVLQVPQVNGTYEPKEMNSDLALQLFSRHAFRSDHPPEDYMELSKNVASTAAGLPLALEVVGSLLRGKRKGVWEDTCKKLRHIPNDEVQKKLMISYEALDHEQKQIFLDISCFCIGVNKRIAVHMWHDCGFYPESSIEVLVDLSLVKIEDDNELRMHDQLRDLGREIVRRENTHEPGGRSRLWSHDEALDVLKAQQGTKKVEALCLQFNRRDFILQRCLTNLAFAKLSNLRFLQMDYVDLQGDFGGLLLKLKWLHWQGAPKNFTPVNFSTKNLTILDLSNSKFTNEWAGWDKLKVAKNLKVLNLSHCLITTTPDLLSHTRLEELILRYSCLEEFHPSVWSLENLRRLDISETRITELPLGLGRLTKLEELEARLCSKMKGELPGDIGNLKCLRTLNLDHTSISLPTSMHLLSQLKSLGLLHHSTCMFRSIPKLPSSLEHLRVTFQVMRPWSHLFELVELRELSFHACYKLVVIPEEIVALTRLRVLNIIGCDELQYVRGLPPSLETLEVSNNLELILIESLSLKNLSFLKVLHVDGNCRLASLDGLQHLRSLAHLEVLSCFSIEKLPDLSNLRKLEIMELGFLSKLGEVQGLDKLKSLKQVVMCMCEKRLSLSILQQVTKLKKFEVFHYKAKERIGDIDILRILENIEGPCKVVGSASSSYFAYHPIWKHDIKFHRNGNINFRSNGPMNLVQLACGNQLYTFNCTDAGYGGNRELSYWLPESHSAYRLSYGDKHYGGSFIDYICLDGGYFPGFCSSDECSNFDLRIESSTNSDQNIFKECNSSKCCVYLIMCVYETLGTPNKIFEPW